MAQVANPPTADDAIIGALVIKDQDGIVSAMLVTPRLLRAEGRMLPPNGWTVSELEAWLTADRQPAFLS